MSQQGIFRIASGGQGGVPSPEHNGEHTSPFRVAGEKPGPGSEQDNVYLADFTDSSQSGKARSEPFQMSGFPEQTEHETIEAAPVAPIRQAVAHMPGNDPYGHGAYEAAKAILEPQQDFAAIPARIGAALSSVAEEFAPQPAGDPGLPAQAYGGQKSRPTQQIQSPVAPMVHSAANGEIQQLELRAIFGVDHLLDIDEILQRARIMPGIRKVVIVEDGEAEAISNFRLAMERMGFGNSGQMKINTGSGSVDFITEGNTTLATLVEGAYAPGVKETLIIVAREIGKLA